MFTSNNMEVIHCILRWCAGRTPGGLLVLVKAKAFSFQNSPVRQVVSLKIRPCNHYLTIRRTRFKDLAIAYSIDSNLPTAGRGVASSANSSAKVRLGAMVHGALSGYCLGYTIVVDNTGGVCDSTDRQTLVQGTMQRV